MLFWRTAWVLTTEFKKFYIKGEKQASVLAFKKKPIYFKMIADSQGFVKIGNRVCWALPHLTSSSGDIFYNSIATWEPRTKKLTLLHYTTTLFSFHFFFYPAFIVCVCVCVVLCNFTPCTDLCNVMIRIWSHSIISGELSHTHPIQAHPSTYPCPYQQPLTCSLSL